MDKALLLQLLTEVQHGQISPQQAAERLAILPYQDLTFARVDHHRALRKGFPEVVFGEMKTPSQILELLCPRSWTQVAGTQHSFGRI